MHHDFCGQFGAALLMAAGMFWAVTWSLVLGCTGAGYRITTRKTMGAPLRQRLALP